jgi:hypothetical protein
MKRAFLMPVDAEGGEEDEERKAEKDTGGRACVNEKDRERESEKVGRVRMGAAAMQQKMDRCRRRATSEGEVRPSKE